MEKHAFHVWRYGRRCWCWQRAPPPSWPFRHQLTRRPSPPFPPGRRFWRRRSWWGCTPSRASPSAFPCPPSRRRGDCCFPSPCAGGEPLRHRGGPDHPLFPGAAGAGGTGGPGGADSPGGGRLPGPGGEPVAVRLSAAAGGGIAGGRGEPLSRGLGTPYGTYLSAGLLGGLPRIACATVLGGALWQPGSGRFWLSLAAGGALTALSGVIWAPVAAPQEGVKRRLLFSAKPCTLLSASSICPMREMVGCRR